MLLTDNSDAACRETETISTDAAVIPDVINTHTVNSQRRH